MFVLNASRKEINQCKYCIEGIMKPKYFCQHKGCMRPAQVELYGKRYCTKHQKELMKMREIRGVVEGQDGLDRKQKLDIQNTGR